MTEKKTAPRKTATPSEQQRAHAGTEPFGAEALRARDDRRQDMFVRSYVRCLQVLRLVCAHRKREPRLRVVAIHPIDPLAKERQEMLSARIAARYRRHEMRFIGECGDSRRFANRLLCGERV